MSALASYLRHLIVVLVFLVIEKLDLPVEGATEVANQVAALVVATATWAVVKYVLPWFKNRNILPLLLVLLVASSLMLFASCAFTDDYDFKGEAVFLSADGAKAGLRWEPGKPVAGFARIAVRDPETGKVTGYSYAEIARKAKIVPEK